MIEDLGSSNGTFVNGRRLEDATPLHPGDTIKCGSSTLLVEAEDAARTDTAVRDTPPDFTAVRQPPMRDDLTAPRTAPTAGGQARPELRVVAGKLAGETIPVTSEAVVIGRDASGPAALDGDPELSHQHARVSRANGSFVVEDLGSTNGTFVNGRRIDEPTVAHSGDAIWLGASTLMVMEPGTSIPEDEAVEAPPSPCAETGLLSRIAGLGDRHPGRVLGVMGVILLIAIVFGAPVAGMLNANNPFNDHSSQSVRVENTIGRATGELPGVQVIALITPPGGVTAPGTRALVAQVSRQMQSDPTVTRTLSYYNTGSRAFVSNNGRSTYVAAFFKNVSDHEADNAASRLLDKVAKPPVVILGGPAVAGHQLGSQVGADLGKAEGLAFPILFILSLWVFRGVVAALMPLFVGGLTVMFTFLVLRIVNSFLPLSQFALNLVIGLGLGLAIDYSLFVVSRYREELARIGRDPDRSQSYGAIPRSEAEGRFVNTESEALRRAMYTAGRTILYSATTVALAIAALCIIPIPFMYSMGIGGAATALVAVSVALIALPALLAVLGPRINAWAPKRWQVAAEKTARAEHEGPWYRLSQGVMRHPATIAVITATVLILLGLPAIGIKFIGVDARAVPEGLTARTVNDTLATQYPSNTSNQITALVTAPPTAAAQVAALAAHVRSRPGAVPGGAPPTALPGGYFTFAVLPRGDPLDAATIALVKSIRANSSPAIETSGTTSSFIDQKSSISSRLPLLVIVICLLTGFVLFLMTGSLILPIKSLLMSFLSLTAAFGVLVLIFQDGHLQGLLGFQSLHAIDLSQPVLIFAVAFGLSSDYTVFLLTRIKEARDAGNSNRDSVAMGLQRTGRIVTCAALLFCVAIGAFATSSIVFIKEVGVGIAVAVIIDATLVRALLVPSLMAMLGDWNWWAPGPLRKLHNKIGLSEK
jgi:RND superfamily putative drug exporter